MNSDPIQAVLLVDSPKASISLMNSNPKENEMPSAIVEIKNEERTTIQPQPPSG